MKKTIYFLTILILFQSCYSYKAFDIKKHRYIESNKVKVKLKNSKWLRGKVLVYKKDELTLKKLDEIIIIPYLEIAKIKERKKSNLKTQLLIRGLGTIILGALFYLALTKI